MTNDIERIAGLVGRVATVWTNEGAVQKGRITKINWRETKLEHGNLVGYALKTPISIELNDDPSEFIDWAIISKIQTR